MRSIVGPIAFLVNETQGAYPRGMPRVYAAPKRRHPDRPLLELDPKWITDNNGRIHGLDFKCPIHEHVPGTSEFPCRHHVGFENPLGGGKAHPYWSVTWERRAGETFETLYLYPSIRNRGSVDDQGRPVGCRWHGYVGFERPGIVMTLDDSQ